MQLTTDELSQLQQSMPQGAYGTVKDLARRFLRNLAQDAPRVMQVTKMLAQATFQNGNVIELINQVWAQQFDLKCLVDFCPELNRVTPFALYTMQIHLNVLFGSITLLLLPV